MKIILRFLTLAFILATALPAAFAGGFFPTRDLPPPTGVYGVIARPVAADFNQDGIINFASGAVLSDLKLKLPSNSEPPPILNFSSVRSSVQDFETKFSNDGGNTFQHFSTTAEVTMRVTLITETHSGADTYATEMLALNISGGDLPAGVMIRESPTLASTGKTVIVEAGTYPENVSFQIDSFFDIFTEISFDGGATWSPADAAEHLVLSASSGEITATTPNLPPLNGHQTGARTADFGNGLVFRNLTLNPAESFPPPAAGETQTHQIMATYDGDVSFNGGQTFSQFSAPATLTLKVTSHLDSENTRFFYTEMLQLDVAGGSLPAPVMLRESPTQASTGGVSVASYNGTFRIASFFDVFPEVSLDGGANWLQKRDGPCVFALPNPVPTVLVSVGDPVPGAGVAGSGVPAGAVFKTVGPLAINVEGTVAFRGTWTAPKNPVGVGVFRRNYKTYQPGQPEYGDLVATVGGMAGGGPLGGGKVIKELKDPGIDDAYVTFLGTLAGADQRAAKPTGIVQFRLADGSTRIVVETGTAVADVPGALLKSITSWAPLGGGQVLFTGTLTGGGIGGKNDRALFATDSAGALHVLIQQGVTPNVVFIGEVIGEVSQTLTVEDFEVLRPMPGANGMTRAFNSNKEVVLKVSYSDRENTTGIVHINVP